MYSGGLFEIQRLVARAGFEPAISALREPFSLCCSIWLDTFLEHLVRRTPGTLCLEYCLVLPGAKKFGSKMAARTAVIFRPLSFDAIVRLTRPGVEPGTY